MKYYHIPLEKILIMAFIESVGLEDKRDIELNAFIKYRNLLLQKMNQWAKKDINKIDIKRCIDIDEELTFDSEFDIDELKDLISDNPHIYSFDGSTIHINEDVTLEEMEEIRTDFDEDDKYILVEFYTNFFMDPESIDILNLTKIKFDLREIVISESVYENYYLKRLFYPGIDSPTELAFRALRGKRFTRLSRFFGDTQKEALLYNYVKKLRPRLKSIFDPSMYDVLEQDTANLKSDVSYINERIGKRDELLTAIFSDESLVYYMLLKLISNNLTLVEEQDEDDSLPLETEPLEGWDKYLENIDDANMEYPEDLEEQEEESKVVFIQDIDGNISCMGADPKTAKELQDAYEVFIIQYMAYIDKYLIEYGLDEEVLLVKNKLNYLRSNTLPIDTRSQREEIERTIGNVRFDLIYENYNNMAEYLIDDLFLNQKREYVIQKLIFIKTCYTLFQSENFIEIFYSYKDHPNFDEYLFFACNITRDDLIKRRREKREN